VVDNRGVLVGSCGVDGGHVSVSNCYGKLESVSAECEVLGADSDDYVSGVD
jgi:hypothetical protein